MESALAHSCGIKANPPCSSCEKGHSLFVECIVISGMLKGACVNCHYNSLSKCCSLRPENQQSTGPAAAGENEKGKEKRKK
ncbi:hypothetical protein I7I48_03061 [Histoplasma ohiense]|nr:hypothetical protein I7I48_03061 [Histoplasma ohiense (nom. inval.)]